MPSAAEQLAANFNFSSFGKATELRQRIFFTLVVLVVARLGTFIPIPGVDPTVLAREISQQHGGLLDVFNVLAGGAITRMAIFALGIMPYISASIIIQLMTTVIPELEALKKEGEAGRKTINQYTRYGTVVLAALQAYGIAIGLEHWNNTVIDPGWFFRISTVITLTGGTVLLMWLGEQITSRGVGNGISLIIFAGIVARFPTYISQIFESGRTGAISSIAIIAMRGRRRGARAVHRVHGAGAAPAARAISETPGRKPHVRRGVIAPAAQAQRVGRHSADLRIVDPVDADDGRGVLSARTCPAGCRRSSPMWGRRSRSISFSTA